MKGWKSMKCRVAGRKKGERITRHMWLTNKLHKILVYTWGVTCIIFGYSNSISNLSLIFSETINCRKNACNKKYVSRWGLQVIFGKFYILVEINANNHNFYGFLMVSPWKSTSR